MSKKVILLLAEGFEDVEAVTPADYLRRAGAEVVVAAVGGTKTVKSSRGLSVLADTTLADLSAAGRLQAVHWDAVVIPGGMPGSANIAASLTALGLVKDVFASGRIVAAICAAPAVVLAPHGMLAGRRFTCFPGMEKGLGGAHWSAERVVTDGHLVTSRGAGTAGEWAVTIIEKLLGAEAARKVAEAVLLRMG